MSPRKAARVLAGVCGLSLLSIFLGAVWVVRHRAHEQVLRKALGLVPGALLHAQDFHWTQMKGDEKQWELRAREASYSEDRTTLRLAGTELSMVLSDGKLVRLIAPNAELRLDGNHVRSAQLSGGLELDYGTTVLRTAEATYIPDKDQLEAPGAVRIQGDGLTVSGVGLEAHPHARVFALEHQVSTELIPRARGDVSKGS